MFTIRILYYRLPYRLFINVEETKNILKGKIMILFEN